MIPEGTGDPAGVPGDAHPPPDTMRRWPMLWAGP
jgi:hypothetical protein